MPYVPGYNMPWPAYQMPPGMPGGAWPYPPVAGALTDDTANPPAPESKGSGKGSGGLSPLESIRDQKILSALEEGQWYSINFDSGACKTALPAEFESRCISTQSLNTPDEFLTASKECVTATKKGRLVADSIAGREVSFSGSLTSGLRKPLLGASEALKHLNGFSILGSEGGIILSRNDRIGKEVEQAVNQVMMRYPASKVQQAVLPLSVEGGVYNLWLKHKSQISEQGKQQYFSR